jgi:NTP pyrophosphatase (non-canonical NTP hydrolase)
MRLSKIFLSIQILNGLLLERRMMFGLSNLFVDACLNKFPTDRIDRLQEELAELIVACSKVKRYGSDSDPVFQNLKEEMADTLITMATLARSLDISESDILREAEMKSLKYGLPPVREEMFLKGAKNGTE